MSWKALLPAFVNCIVTIGRPVCGSKSACVPDSFSSLPDICGYGLSSSSG